MNPLTKDDITELIEYIQTISYGHPHAEKWIHESISHLDDMVDDIYFENIDQDREDIINMAKKELMKEHDAMVNNMFDKIRKRYS